VNFNYALFFLLDFVASEVGADGLSQNVSKEIPLSAV